MSRPSLLAALALVLALAAGVAAWAGVPGTPGSPTGSPPGAAATADPTAGPGSPTHPLPSPSAPAPSPSAPGPSPSGPAPSPAPTGTTSLRPVPAGELEERLDRFRRRHGVPGISVTILWGDGRSWTGTTGLADVEANRKVVPGTAFAIASISKTFLAALVLQLADEGRFDLDDPVVRHLPGVRVDRRITIRQLLDHTSGLHDYFLNPKIDPALRARPTRRWTAADALRYVGKAYFRPGTGFHYSNTNYLLLGLLAERVTARSVAEELRERFIDPLGLTSVHYQAVERPRARLAHGYRFNGPSRTARPIDLSDGSGIVPFTSVVTAAGPAGSLAATSADVARWARALYGGDVLEPALLAAMLDGAAATVRYRPRVPYGLGVQELSIGAWRTYGHSGRFLGFRSVMRYLPVQDLSIAVLTNQSRADPSILVGELLEVALPRPQPCRACR